VWITHYDYQWKRIGLYHCAVVVRSCVCLGQQTKHQLGQDDVLVDWKHHLLETFLDWDEDAEQQRINLVLKLHVFGLHILHGFIEELG
jgi:hypothetical protein